MKRRWKIFWIVCAVLAAAGLILTAAGIILGAPVRGSEGERRLTAWLEEFRENSADAGSRALEKIDAIPSSSGYTAQEPDGENILGFEGVQNLEIDVTELAVIANVYDGGQVTVDMKRLDSEVREQMKIRMHGGKLEIETEEKDRFRSLAADHTSDELTLFISIPQDTEMEEITADVGAGYLEMTGISAKKLSVSADAGKADISGFSAERLEAECGAGQLVLEGGASEKAKLECGAGEVIYTVPGVREDYNYEMECDVGEIEIGGDSYSGLGVERKEDNRSPYSIEAECRMGRIEILFR